MQIDIITIFPKIFDSYLKESFIRKAAEKGLLEIKIHDLRKWAAGRHKAVDDRPFGGGLGMVIKIEPVYRAVREILKKDGQKKRKKKIILFTPRGEKFDQKKAYSFSKLDRLIMICGRYEGVDERAAKYIADIELSLGDFDLMGGEVPAMAVIEATARLIPGLIGKPALLKERITKNKGFIEYPQYTRPEIFSPPELFKKNRAKKWKVPPVLLSGHHSRIEEWREKEGKAIEK